MPTHVSATAIMLSFSLHVQERMEFLVKEFLKSMGAVEWKAEEKYSILDADFANMDVNVQFLTTQQ